MAAFIEGFISASALPYSAKAGIAILSAVLILIYLTLGGPRLVGRPRRNGGLQDLVAKSP